MMNRKKIDRAYDAALTGRVLSHNEIVELLSIDTSSEECSYLRNRAHEASLQLTGGGAYLWGAIGVDYASCAMNCDFCSFGKAWGLITDEKIYSIDEIIARVGEYVADGVHFIVLRTTQHYSLETISEFVNSIRKSIKGNYEIVANVGEFDLDTANRLYDNGVDGIYHAIRLREGINTHFRIAEREATLDAIHHSPLNLIHLVEPVGAEHSYDEIAERFLGAVRYGAYISGIMARIPVAGTPLGCQPRISDEEIAKLTAVLRLSGGSIVKHICVHPASELSLMSGANVAVIETGAIPRDNTLAENKWRQFDCKTARQLFERCGYRVIS